MTFNDNDNHFRNFLDFSSYNVEPYALNIWLSDSPYELRKFIFFEIIRRNLQKIQDNVEVSKSRAIKDVFMLLKGWKLSKFWSATFEAEQQ